VCQKHAGFQTTHEAVNCSGDFISSGSSCAADVVAVLRFGDFRRPDGPRAVESVEKCVNWLLEARYVLVVHTNEKRDEDHDDADTYYSGSGVIVDLTTGKAVGRLTLEGDDKARLGHNVSSNRSAPDQSPSARQC